MFLTKIQSKIFCLLVVLIFLVISSSFSQSQETENIAIKLRGTWYLINWKNFGFSEMPSMYIDNKGHNLDINSSWEGWPSFFGELIAGDPYISWGGNMIEWRNKNWRNFPISSIQCLLSEEKIDDSLVLWVNYESEEKMEFTQKKDL